MRLSVRRMLPVVVLALLPPVPGLAGVVSPVADDTSRVSRICDRSAVVRVARDLEEQILRFRAALPIVELTAEDVVERARELARLAEDASSCEGLRHAAGELETSSYGLDVAYRQAIAAREADPLLEQAFLTIEETIRRVRRVVGGAPVPSYLPPVEPIPASCDDAQLLRHVRGLAAQALRLSAALRAGDGFEGLAKDAAKVAERARGVEQLAGEAARCDDLRRAVGRVERSFGAFHVHYQMAVSFHPPTASTEREMRRLERMVRALRRLVGGRPVPAPP